MSDLKPGEYRITEKAIQRWELPEGSQVLDLGCGRGDTLNYLREKFGLLGVGLDASLKMIEKGKNQYPQLQLKHGEMESLGAFLPNAFDGVLAECSLSVSQRPEEALQEAYGVLKKGGNLFISDLYIKNPTMEYMIELSRKEVEDSASNFRSYGRFIIRSLVKTLEKIGYEEIFWEDCTQELDRYVAEKIMRDGTLEGCMCEGAICPLDSFKTGYFMLTAKKPL